MGAITPGYNCGSDSEIVTVPVDVPVLEVDEIIKTSIQGLTKQLADRGGAGLIGARFEGVAVFGVVRAHFGCAGLSLR